MKLKKKIIISVVPILLLMGIMTTLSVTFYLKRRLVSDIKFSIKNLAISVKTLSEFPLANYDYSLLKRNLTSVFSDRISYIIVFDAKGIIAGAVYKKDLEDSIYNRKVTGEDFLKEKEEEIEINGRVFYEISMPIKATGFNKPLGVVKIGVKQEEIYSTVMHTVFYILAFLMGSVIFSIIIVLAVSDAISKPLSQLSNAAEKIASGNFSIEIPTIETPDEIGKLTIAFKKMARRIEETLKELEKYQQELEDKIKERTQSLRLAMEKLENSRKKIEEAERISQISKVISEISHQINNPVSIILANIEMLMKTTDDEKFKKRLSTIKQASKRISSLIDKVDMLVKSDVGVRNLVDLNSVVEKLKQIYEERGVKFEVGPGKKPVFANEEYLVEALKELIDNALEAVEGKEDGNVVVKLTIDENSNEFVIEIQDTGTGMDAETLNKALNPFFTSKPDKKGLGLTIAGNIIKSHGGKMEISSKEGEGTNVRVSFKI